MNRCRCLGVAGGFIAALAGCLSGENPSLSDGTTATSTPTASPSPETPTEIADVRFHMFKNINLYRIDEESTDYTGPTFSSPADSHHAASVRFRPESNRVLVDGWMDSGSRSCRTTKLDAVRYDPVTNTLWLTVRDTFEEGSDRCSTESAPVLYRATVDVVAESPETVHITHYGEARGQNTYSETFHSESTTTTVAE